ncbi:L-threonylcarbamoyladenylate synthase [Bifidobacterium xylocopae]|uniref:L-threonylcarbamoyladenylate synthase n=1 Tax=Bifidobacterium xylocopae TaxID=2493119 RepID=A0A366KF44_9BIFI|nr:L-threonylcarbamoyladenylate synthase [Bifidobacterium xylocopae]RBP99852.1 threonylcarbamoyl-AMP synthase [Bifidobacterium xylocopae]
MGEIVDIDQESLAGLKRVIAAGGLAVIPTDTVYGIVCDPFNDRAIDALFAAKERPRTKSLQILLPSVADIDRLGLDLPAPLDSLAARFLPGAFSPVCRARTGCRLRTLRHDADGRTQAVRVPACEPCLAALAAAGPLAASSANISGQPSVQTVQEAYGQLGERVDLYLDGGPTPGPTPSTVVAADAGAPAGFVVLREGAIASAAIAAALSGSIGDDRR